MTSHLHQLVSLSRATKSAHDSSTDPDERTQLEIIGGQVAKMIGSAVVGEKRMRMRNSNTSTEQTS